MKRILFFSVSMMISAGCASMSEKDPAMAKGEGCQTPLGFIAEGKSAMGYLRQFESRGESCKQGTISCENGVWTGAYIYPSCVVSP